MLGIFECAFGNRLSIDFNCSGIYGIRHTASGRIYVGSAKNIPVDDLTESLAIIRQIMNILQQRFNAQTVVYEICFEHDPGDGKSLMHHLKYGFEAFKEDSSTDERLEIYVRRDNEITKWLKD